MVKGISRQVIVVRSPDPELFDQAIFILKDSAVRKGVTEEMLLRQARQAIGRSRKIPWNLLWLSLGAALTGVAWGITALI